MMLDYELADRALNDLQSIRRWYDAISLDLGNRFIDEVLAAVRAAREHPNMHPVVQGEKRAVRCKRFRYRIYYEVLENRVIVLAVYHTSRDPARWDDPLRE
jgi:toxin ParE1/3/4